MTRNGTQGGSLCMRIQDAVGVGGTLAFLHPPVASMTTPRLLARKPPGNGLSYFFSTLTVAFRSYSRLVVRVCPTVAQRRAREGLMSGYEGGGRVAGALLVL